MKNILEKILKETIEDTYIIHGKQICLSDLGWDYGWHNKKRAWGTCFPSQKKVKLSKFLLTNSEFRLDQWKNTILHEVAHAIDWELNGQTDHSKRWKRIAKAIGCNGERCTRGKYVNKEDVFKHILECPNCERKVYKHRMRKNLACGSCCKKYNNNQWSEEFVLKKIN